MCHQILHGAGLVCCAHEPKLMPEQTTGSGQDERTRVVARQ